MFNILNILNILVLKYTEIINKKCLGVYLKLL